MAGGEGERPNPWLPTDPSGTNEPSLPSSSASLAGQMKHMPPRVFVQSSRSATAPVTNNSYQSA